MNRISFLLIILIVPCFILASEDGNEKKMQPRIALGTNMLFLDPIDVSIGGEFGLLYKKRLYQSILVYAKSEAGKIMYSIGYEYPLFPDFMRFGAGIQAGVHQKNLLPAYQFNSFGGIYVSLMGGYKKGYIQFRPVLLLGYENQASNKMYFSFDLNAVFEF